MGKRSDFKRRPMDSYQTIDPRAVEALMPFLGDVRSFVEPCRGEGQLERQLIAKGLVCSWSSDIEDNVLSIDALTLDKTHFGVIDAIITNPPWTRTVLHKMIRHFQELAPTWLLFDADWCHTKQAAPYLPQCSHIVTAGRLKWIEGTKQTGKDNCAWYRFDVQHTDGPRFFGPTDVTSQTLTRKIYPHPFSPTYDLLADDVGINSLTSSADHELTPVDIESDVTFWDTEQAKQVNDLDDIFGDSLFLGNGSEEQVVKNGGGGRSVAGSDLSDLLC